MQGGRDEGQRKEEERKGEKSEEGMWRREGDEGGRGRVLV